MIRLLCVVGNIYPPKTGGDQAVFNALKLLQNYTDLHVFVLYRGSSFKYESAFKNEIPNAKFEFFNQKNRDTYETVYQLTLHLRNYFVKILRLQKVALNRELQFSLNLERNANLYLALNQYISNNCIDIVQLEFASSLHWVEGIIVPVKKVFIQHEIQYIVKKQRLSPCSDVYEILHWGIERNCEIAMMNAYDAVITLSENDKDLLVKDGVNVPIYASFAKTQMRHFQRFDYVSLQEVDLVFVGPESHIPNKKGMIWFLDNVWPRILNYEPNLKLHIVGKWSNNTISVWSNKYNNLCFDGFVDDLVSALQKKILIVPIREGSGIRMKILEAVNIGVAFVSCSVGAEGLGFEDTKNCFITDDPVVFAERIIFLLSNRIFLQKMADDAHQYILEKFSDARFVDSRMSCYNMLFNS